MRIWDRLKLWVDEEAQAVNMYKRLSDASELFQRGKTGLWRPPDLQLALNWKRKQQPTLTWAEQYNPAFERTMVFLDTSEKDFIAEEENKIRLQKRSLRRSRIFAAVLGTAAIVSIGLMLWSFVLRGEALKATNEALFQTAVADTARDVALVEQERALMEAERARIAQLAADSSADVATAQKLLADLSAQEAIDAQGEAEASAQIATEQQEIAVQEAARATEQQRLALLASDEAKRNQTLSTAQSMAVKSLQVDNDNNLKALLAFQSYLFNLDNKGIVHHADIYLALHDAALAQKGQDFNVYPGHTQGVRSLVFQPGSGTFFSASSDGKVLKWDINDSDKKSTVVIDNQLVNRILDISNDGKWLACGTEGKGIQLFDISRSGTGNPTVLSGHNNTIRALDFMPDNQTMLSAGRNDSQILKWNLSNNSSSVFTTVDSIQVLAISGDGKWVSGGTVNGKLVLIDADNPSNKTTLVFEDRNEILSLSFSPDGKLLASGDKNGNVKIWDIAQKSMIINLRGHSSRISNLQFSPDGSILASTSFDASVRLWDATDWNNQPFVIQDNNGYVYSVTFSPDGNYIMSGSQDGPNRLVMNPTKTEVLVRDICDMVERNFTQEEWETYIGTTIDYEETCGRATSIGVREN